MLTSTDLKKIVAQTRPLIEQQLDLTEQIAGLREVVTAAGGDWSQLKALVKAQIQDERDEAGDGKRVRKILDKADYAASYADMLGMAKMNEKNSFGGNDTDPAFDRWLAEVADRVDPALLIQIIEGSKSAAGRAIIMAAIKVVREERAHETLPDHDPETGVILEPENSGSDMQDGSGPAEVHTLGKAGSTPAPATPLPAEPTGEDRSGQGVSSSLAKPASVANVLSIRTHNPETHLLSSEGLVRLHGCLRPENCGSSQPRVKLCFGCSVKHEGPAPETAVHA